MNGFQTKEQIITDYLSGINFESGDWNYRQLQLGLRDKIGEMPAIDIEYVKDVKINEINSEATEIRKINKINVIFSPELDTSFKKLTFKIGT
jgi:hypothetical protein